MITEVMGPYELNRKNNRGGTREADEQKPRK